MSVDFTTRDGTAIAGSDYRSTSGSLIIPAGETSRQITVEITDDTLYEADESFTLELSNADHATIVDNQGVGTISNSDNDPMPTLSIDDVAADEGHQTMSFTVSLSIDSGLPVTVDFATNDLTASGGDDYSATSGQLSIPAGERAASITVNINDDLLDEEEETFEVTLSNAQNATTADPQAVGTITDNDPPPTVSLTLSDSPLSENGGLATVEASLSALSALTVTVELRFSGSATANSVDYSASANAIVVPAGSSRAHITLTGLSDELDEADESIVVEITTVSHGTENGEQQVTAQIADDDVAPLNINISGAETSHIQKRETFTATLSPSDSTTPITYTWQASGRDPITHLRDRLEDSVTFEWNTPGPQTISVTAANASGVVSNTHLITIEVPPTEITISGPEEGTLGTSYRFVANAGRSDSSRPLRSERLRQITSPFAFGF